MGRAILKALEVRASELGFEILHLHTTVQQSEAQAFYLANGFEEAGRGKHGPFDIIFYEKAV